MNKENLIPKKDVFKSKENIFNST